MRRPSRLLFTILCGAGCSGRSVGPAPSFNVGTTDEDARADEDVQAPVVSAGDVPGAADPFPQSSASGAVDATDGAATNANARAGGGSDAGPDGACALPLAPGDLAIDELMIESVVGAGDYGEWIEVQSRLDCMADIRGLHGECPRGAKVATFDVTTDVWLPARGTFVIADSSDPAINHDLPGLVIVWFGQPGDVLRNKGSTITLSLGGTLLDTVTYPALALAAGDSWAFPDDCDPSARSDFTKWKRSTASWFPGFLGTPNQPNTDVACDANESAAARDP
jgi:hypothetical protein